MGHYSAGFTLDTDGHLMESVPKRQVEWIDELVFLEGLEAALKLHTSGAQSGVAPCSPVLPSEGREPKQDVPSGNAVQSGAVGFLVAAEGFEPPTPRV